MNKIIGNGNVVGNGNVINGRKVVGNGNVIGDNKVVHTEKIFLKPCPFCGGEAEIVVCDDEGNIHDEEYLLRPYSGVGFNITHVFERNKCCPIARYEDDEAVMGVRIYDTREDAIAAWNNRVDKNVANAMLYI